MLRLRLWLSISLIFGGLIGCTGGGDGDSAKGEKVTEAGRVDISSPLQTAFSHVKDSSGTTAEEGSELILIFQPADIALLYLASQDEAIAHHGIWKYDTGKLSLQIGKKRMDPDAPFALDLGDEEVTMPFQALGVDTGTSTWRAHPLPLDIGIRTVFNGVAADEDLDLKAADAVDRAHAYAEAVIRAGGSAGDGKQSLPAKSGPLLISAVRPATGDAAGIEKIVKLSDGIQITYMDKDRPPLKVMLFSYKPAKAGTPLTPGPLASDPRVHIDVESPANNADDPPTDTALFITPIVQYKNVLSWFSKEETTLDGGEIEVQTAAVDRAKGALKERGYTVEHLTGRNATVDGIIKAFGTNKPAPGFVFYSGHGGTNGVLMTGDYVGEGFCSAKEIIESEDKTQPNEEKCIYDKAASKKLVADRIAVLRKAYPGLFDYKGGNGEETIKVGPISAGHGLRPGDVSFYLGVYPLFWEWIREGQKVSFGRSLVYIAGCSTDFSEHLRQAFQARAYFAYGFTTYELVMMGVLEYLVQSLAHPSRSAEEAYYNLIRVTNTRQMIYEEDKVFDGVIGAKGQDVDVEERFTRLLDVLNGWGYEGTTFTKYNGNGWLDPHLVNGGQVWWMVFSGRWGQNANVGSQKLENCWNLFWSKGDKGGLASPGCNASNAGDVPKVDEVAYAQYLLGSPKQGFSGTRLPRWTLNDG